MIKHKLLPIKEMLREHSLQEVLKTMPSRDRLEQDLVWTAGLQKWLQDSTAASNRAAGRLVERVKDGHVVGLFFDPLDVASAYVRDELRKSRSREEGERKRQMWLLDLLEKIGEARIAGAGTLIEYPPAAALMEQEPVSEAA